MRYFIGCHIRGEAAEFVKATTSDLAARFGITDVTTIAPPYMTVKAPFERNNLEMVEEVISLATEVPPRPLTLSGWNHFDNRTIFIDAKDSSPELTSYLRSVLAKLRAIGLPVNPLEDKLHLHLSVARFLKPKEYEEIWKYLSTIPVPKFDIMFDNLTIYTKEKKEDKAWKTLKTFPLTGRI